MKEKNPKNLEECFSFLKEKAEEKDLKEWMKKKEDDATVSIHHSLGRNIRNNWNLWDEKSQLHKYFNGLGIKHADDMSSIIFTSFHRFLNKKEIDLEGQLKFYWKYWIDYSKEENEVNELLPPSIKGVQEKYLKLYKETFKK